MKLSRTKIFILISSIALSAVLIIQVKWIFKTAKIKEDIFNEKANMVLSRTTEAIRSDTETCREIGACVQEDSVSESAVKLGLNEERKIDSLFSYYMKFYNVHVDYTYEVKKASSSDEHSISKIADYTYNKPLENRPGNTGVGLKLIIPDKKEFILAEMGTLFVTSVILILVVLALFWRTILLLIKEKRISETTNDFLNNMTHEFKTPLTNIALAGTMIKKETTSHWDEKLKRYTEIILEENEKLRLQVERVLSMTALERGEIPLQKTDFDFHALIREACKHIQLQIENKQGNINLNLNAGNSIVHGDKYHLTNALSGLIENAIKYSYHKPEISIETFNKDRNLIVKISDKGIGIEKEYHKQVFDKYFRVPTGDVHDVKGFGLGLAYIKMIVELHKGTIVLDSEKGKGTSFTIAFPND